MAITYVPAPDVVVPNITVERTMQDGAHVGWRITANDGYVLYDPLDDVEVIDPETGLPTGEIEHSYFRVAYIPAKHAPETWTYTAVLESEVPADRIFGDEDKPEVM